MLNSMSKELDSSFSTISVLAENLWGWKETLSQMPKHQAVFLANTDV